MVESDNTDTNKDWRELCAEVVDETDSRKVVSLVNQILQAFDERDQKASGSQTLSDQES
jgi:hypothetical protein